MGIADIPTKLGTDFLIRTALPGLVSFIVFFEPVIYPLIRNTWGVLVFSDKLLVWLFYGLAVGLIFVLCDLYIYQLFEGIRFWPEFLWKWQYGRIQIYSQNLEEELKMLIQKRKSSTLNHKERMKLNLEIRKLSDRIREFPPDYEKGRRYPAYPTRFGNVLCEYEDYSLNRYGINMVVFWDHLTQILPKETKEELKLKSAMADLCVYLCFISLVYVLLGPAAFLFQEESWTIIWNYSIPAKSFLYLFFSILILKAFYELSITQHKSYGSFVKSIFDLYRLKLAKKLGIKVRRYYSSMKELEEEQDLWDKYMHFYLHYTFIDHNNEQNTISGIR